MSANTKKKAIRNAFLYRKESESLKIIIEATRKLTIPKTKGVNASMLKISTPVKRLQKNCDFCTEVL